MRPVTVEVVPGAHVERRPQRRPGKIDHEEPRLRVGELLGARQPLDHRQRLAVLAEGDRHRSRFERQPAALATGHQVDVDELAGLRLGGVLRLVAGAQQREAVAVGAEVRAAPGDTRTQLHAPHHGQGRGIDDRSTRLAGRLVAALVLVLAGPQVEHHEARPIRAPQHCRRRARQRQRPEPLSGRQVQGNEGARPRVEHVGPGRLLREAGAGRPQARESQSETDQRRPVSHRRPQWNVIPISNETTSWLQPPKTVSPSKSRSPGLP